MEKFFCIEGGKPVKDFGEACIFSVTFFEKTFQSQGVGFIFGDK